MAFRPTGRRRSRPCCIAPSATGARFKENILHHPRPAEAGILCSSLHPFCPSRPPPRNHPMQALVYHGPGKQNLEDVPRPGLREATDAVVRITKTTICGTDLHILKGEV